MVNVSRWSPWTKTIYVGGKTQKVPSARDGKGLRWLARYVDEQGREHTKAYGKKPMRRAG